LDSPALHIIDQPDQAAGALHPLRLRLLAELRNPGSATTLSGRLGLPRQVLNYHLRQLEADGLVELVEKRPRRGCTERIFRSVASAYLISPSVLGAVASDPSQMPDRMSSAYLVAVAAQVIREVAALREGAARAEKQLPTLTLRADVRFASPEAQHQFATDLATAVADVVARYHDAAAPEGRTFRLIAGAYPAPAGAPSSALEKEESS
jgi:DNA-binding transcriptional ArsR family regulator